jgi:hypothetical protein
MFCGETLRILVKNTANLRNLRICRGFNKKMRIWDLPTGTPKVCDSGMNPRICGFSICGLKKICLLEF